jgi:hypothetical protein
LHHTVELELVALGFFRPGTRPVGLTALQVAFSSPEAAALPKALSIR